MTEQSSSPEKPKAKKAKGETVESLRKDLDETKALLNKLIKCFEEVSTHSGQANYIVNHGFTRYKPTKEDMSRYT